MPVNKKSIKNLTPGSTGKKVKRLPAVVSKTGDKLDLPSYDVLGLTYREVMFCHHYLMDYKPINAYQKAGYSMFNIDAARAAASNLVRRENVVKYIDALQKNMEQTSGVTRLRVIKELERMAFTSMAHFRNNSWLTVKEFSELTEDQKACIAEITTEVRSVRQQRDDEEGVTTTASIDHVKIKLYDKQKALDMLNKMLGFDAPIVIETKNTDRKTIAELFPPLPPKP